MKHRFPEKLAAAFASRRKFALVTIVETKGSAPQAAGARMIVYEDGSIEGTVGGGAIEYRLIKEASDVINLDRPKLMQFDLKEDVGMVCGGNMSAFLEPMAVGQPVVIMGCGHVSRAIAPLLVNLDFDVTVVDERPEWAAPDGFPPEVKVVCQEFMAYCETQGDVSGISVLVMTRGHEFDYELLHHFVEQNPAYLGVLGSKNKSAAMRKRLLDSGVAQDQIDRVSMPMGIPIQSSTPHEIAVSVAGELIKLRNTKS